MKHPVTLKGLQEMRTNTDAAISTALPHKLHMKLCCLEMERHRRDLERKVAMERANKCQARCEVIDLEVRRLLDVINKQSAAQAELKPIALRAPLPVAATSTATAGQVSSRPMTHRY